MDLSGFAKREKTGSVRADGRILRGHGATGLSIRTAATHPLYADMSGKYHGVPPLMVEDLRLMESFVDPPSTHKSPLNRNHPRKLAAEQQDS